MGASNNDYHFEMPSITIKTRYYYRDLFLTHETNEAVGYPLGETMSPTSEKK